MEEIRRKMKLANALNVIRDPLTQFGRNGRWGTCVDCPRDNLGLSYPEFCANTTRLDHQLTIEDLAKYWNIEMKDVDG